MVCMNVNAEIFKITQVPKIDLGDWRYSFLGISETLDQIPNDINDCIREVDEFCRPDSNENEWEKASEAYHKIKELASTCKTEIKAAIQNPDVDKRYHDQMKSWIKNVQLRADLIETKYIAVKELREEDKEA